MFLDECEIRPVQIRDSRGLEIAGLLLGKGPQPLEVLVAHAPRRPNQVDLKAVWNSRLAGRAAPLVLVVLHGHERSALCGPAGDEPAVFLDLDAPRVERICRTALEEPDRHAALRFLRGAIPEVDTPLPGLRNEGLFATHELHAGVPLRADWAAAEAASRPILNKRKSDLIQSLGFAIDHLPGPGSILRAAGTKVAVAILLERNESPDVASPRFSDLSPVSYALAKADEENLPFVLVLTGPALRLYPARTGIGIGRRGRTETYAEIHLDLIEGDKAAYLWLLFSASALVPGGSFEQIMARSGDFAVDLGERLRERVYSSVLPRLAEAMLKARDLKRPDRDQLELTYEMALLVLFRLLFIAYAEDKDLLPYRHNDLYRARSLKQKARELTKLIEAGTPFDSSSTHWDDCLTLFRAVDEGKGEWGVPPYNGGMFSSKSAVSKAGADLAATSLPNTAMGPALVGLLIDDSPEGRGPVDFRSLGVREFGTIYEGLLENDLAVADIDLSVGKDGIYRPAKAKDTIVVPAGRAYLHNASGARKSTGSYFTKDFAVDHLLDHALEPALEDHLRRLDKLQNDRKRAESFFDFRTADLAMGSGHFLVAAVDRIERRLSGYLSKRHLPDVMSELRRLRTKAMEALGPLAEGVEIEDTQLLRRQIARRCIYGVDINPLAVELTRLSIWVHTFVPGLPLSFLDHNLVRGNSLVGVATVHEAEDCLKEIAGGLFYLSADELVGSAREAMGRLAVLSDADASEIAAARMAFKEASRSAAPAASLFGILAASRIDDALAQDAHGAASHWISDMDKLPGSKEARRAETILAGLHPLHFPVAFPEVFLRERAGFDVILGNPPWEEATVEEDRFWTRYFPGFHSLAQHEQEQKKKKLRRTRPDLIAAYERELAEAELMRRVLVSGPFPGMGTGDPDLYKAFAWRFIHLAADDGGRVGVVLPRSAFSAKGSTDFRKELFLHNNIPDLTSLLNNKSWVFEDVHPQYTIALVTLCRKRAKESDPVCLKGPYRSYEGYMRGVKEEPNRYSVIEIMSWTDTAALPLLPDDRSGEVFTQLRKAPRLDAAGGSWIARPYAELHATNDKGLMKLTEKRPEGHWPIFKGESFDIWEADTGSYYAWGDPEVLLPHLNLKRQRARTALEGFSPAWLRDPKTLRCLSARIAFRDVTNRTNRRTVIAALIPPKSFLTNKAPYFLWPKGDAKDEAFLVGLLCSLPLDWYARRFVEISLNFFILNPFPIPRPTRSNPLWQRVVALAGRLACPDRRFASWAKEAGVDHGRLNEDEKTDMVHELDAVAAHLYGLSAKQLTHVFETFHEGWDYEDRLKRTLEHYSAWRARA